MKCPVMTFYLGNGAPDAALRQVDCLHAECAWWDWKNDLCCARSLPYELRTLSQHLVNIANLMPRRG